MSQKAGSMIGTGSVQKSIWTLGVLAMTGTLAWGFYVQAFRVPYGTRIGDTSLSAMRWQEARLVLQEHAKAGEDRPLTLDVGGCVCAAPPAKLGVQIAVDRTLEGLRSQAKVRPLLSKLLARKLDVTWDLQLTEPAFSEFIEGCEAKCIAARPSAGTLRPRPGARDGTVEVVAPQTGTAIDVEPLKGAIGAALVKLDDTALPVPTKSVTPLPSRETLERAAARVNGLLAKPIVLTSNLEGRRITLLRSELSKLLDYPRTPNGELDIRLSRERLAAWLAPRRHRVEQPARNATFQVTKNGKLEPVPEAAGSTIALLPLADALEAALKSGQTSVDIPYEPTKPATLVTADIEHLGIHELVSSFTTHHACCQPRVKNIHRIADLVNGAIVLPGAVFSLNEFVGPRTLENGFVAAPSIQDGDMLDSVGGGISQFATTFYNAAMRGGYEILERQAHSYWFERYPMGHEATLTWPKPDLVIRNDTASGLLILTSYDEKSITVKFYGDKEGRRVTWGVSQRFDILLPKTEYLPNLELEPDKEKVKEGGCIGWSVTTTRTVALKDGTKREDKRKIIYKPRIRRVEVHPCKIPEGEPGATGEKCPKPREPEPDTESGATPAPSPS